MTAFRRVSRDFKMALFYVKCSIKQFEKREVPMVNHENITLRNVFLYDAQLQFCKSNTFQRYFVTALMSCFEKEVNFITYVS